MAAAAPSVKMPRRLHVFGASGSGTTSLASLLAAQHGHRHLDTDDFFWLPTDPPYRDKRPRQLRLELLRRALGEAPWDYSYAPGNVGGLARPDFLPLWGLYGLALEPLHDALTGRAAPFPAARRASQAPR